MPPHGPRDSARALVVVTVALLILTTLASNASANATYRSRAAFEASNSVPSLLEDFDRFHDGQVVTQLFGGLVTFDAPYPTIFFGGWNGLGTGGVFTGTGTGRIYTLTATAGDVAGNVAVATATCAVPHDQRR